MVIDGFHVCFMVIVCLCGVQGWAMEAYVHHDSVGM